MPGYKVFRNHSSPLVDLAQDHQKPRASFNDSGLGKWNDGEWAQYWPQGPRILGFFEAPGRG